MARSKIITGLKEAVKYSRGDKSRGKSTMVNVPVVERCSWHKPDNSPFLHAHADAEERMKRGEKQRQCKKCGLWHWPHEWGKEPS